MDRVYESGASVTPPSPPASPSSGYPASGNPQTATLATKPGPWWYHMITEELRAIIAAAGIPPDHTQTNQLSQAIQYMIKGGDYKDSVRVATTANIALTGTQTIDGIAVVAGDRVLVKDQTAAAENGIYVVAAGAWARADDADGSGDLTAGAIVPVETGSLNADTLWMLTTDGSITIGTTALTFKLRSGRAGSIQPLTDGATITPDFAAAENFSVTLGGNRTLANPTNITAGQSGVIAVSQDATGGRTLAFGSYWKFEGGAVPSLSTTPSALDLLVYYCHSATAITVRMISAVA
jgi:hypothetical protein